MPTAFSCFSSPPPCRGQLPVGGCLAIFVLLIKNSATQYCIRASVTFFVCLRLLSWAQLLFGNSKDISQILLRTSYPSPQFCCQPCLSHWLSWEVRKKKSASWATSQSCGTQQERRKSISNKLLVMLTQEPLAWPEVSANLSGPCGFSHLPLSAAWGPFPRWQRQG